MKSDKLFSSKDKAPRIAARENSNTKLKKYGGDNIFVENFKIAWPGEKSCENSNKKSAPFE